MYEVLGHPVHVQPSRPRKEPKVSILFRQTEELQVGQPTEALAPTHFSSAFLSGKLRKVVVLCSTPAASTP